MLLMDLQLHNLHFLKTKGKSTCTPPLISNSDTLETPRCQGARRPSVRDQLYFNTSCPIFKIRELIPLYKVHSKT